MKKKIMAVTLSVLLVEGVIGGFAYAKDVFANDEVSETTVEVDLSFSLSKRPLITAEK